VLAIDGGASFTHAASDKITMVSARPHAATFCPAYAVAAAAPGLVRAQRFKPPAAAAY